MDNQEATTPAKGIEPENEAELTPGKGVLVSEDFQKQAHALIGKANKHEVKHIHERAYTREEELRQEEMKKDKKGKSKGPESYSVEDMPKD